jgi:hypothetical protein
MKGRGLSFTTSITIFLKYSKHGTGSEDGKNNSEKKNISSILGGPTFSIETIAP